MQAQAQAQELAAVAVELRVAMSITERAFAVRVAAVAVRLARDELEELAARIGLSADATAHILTDHDRCLEGLGAAHRLLRALIPHADTVARLAGEEDLP